MGFLSRCFLFYRSVVAKVSIPWFAEVLARDVLFIVPVSLCYKTGLACDLLNYPRKNLTETAGIAFGRKKETK